MLGKNKILSIFIFLILLLSFFVWLIWPKLGDKNTKTTTISGTREFPTGLFVDTEEVLVIKPGTIIKMGPNTKITVKGKIIAKGTSNSPITLSSTNSYWRGIEIRGSRGEITSTDYWDWIREGDNEREEDFIKEINNGHVFDFVEFKNISTKDQKLAYENKFMGSLEVYNSTIRVSNSKFEDVLHIGGILTKNSFLVANNNIFDSDPLHKQINSTENTVALIHNNKIFAKRSVNQPCADGIWINDSAGFLSSNEIRGVGDDAIDSDRSRLLIYKNTIDGAKDEGIDIDASGVAVVINNKIKNIEENGILISDYSNATLINNEVSFAEWGLNLRNGSRVVADNLSLFENETGIFLSQDTPCVLQNKDFLSIISDLKQVDLKTLKNNIVLKDVNINEDLVKIFESHYQKEGDLWKIRKEESSLEGLKALREVLKLIDLSSINWQTGTSQKKDFCSSLDSELLIEGMVLRNNKKDLASQGNHRTNIPADGNNNLGSEVSLDALTTEAKQSYEKRAKELILIIDRFK